jgi:ubiquinone/menaquinone biosynthesis C-methylase UbiE
MAPDSFAARAATYSNSQWHAELAERFVEWLGLAAGLTVVDIGTGTGFAALAVARVADGPTGSDEVAGGGTAGGGGAGTGAGASGTRVLGVDRSPAMLSVARERAAAAGRDAAVSFAVGDGHRLGLRDRCADAALFVTSLHYMTAGLAMAEAARIVRSGGIVAIATLRTGALVPSELFRAVLAEHGVAAPDRMAATGSRDRLSALLEGAGLGQVETGQDTLRLADADLADAWPVNATMAARRLADWPESDVAALRERWEARVAAARADDEEGFRSITMLMARARRADR